jgi:hypothetical protein
VTSGSDTSDVLVGACGTRRQAWVGAVLCFSLDAVRSHARRQAPLSSRATHLPQSWTYCNVCKRVGGPPRMRRNRPSSSLAMASPARSTYGHLPVGGLRLRGRECSRARPGAYVSAAVPESTARLVLGWLAGWTMEKHAIVSCAGIIRRCFWHCEADGYSMGSVLQDERRRPALWHL